MVRSALPHPCRRRLFCLLGAVLTPVCVLPLLGAQQDSAGARKTTPAVAESKGASLPSGTANEEPFLYDAQSTQLQAQSPRWWMFALSPNAKTLAVCTGDQQTAGEILIFDMPAGTLRATLKNPMGVRCVAFSPDSKTLAAGTFDNFLRLYDVGTLRLKAIGIGHRGAVNSVAISSDGKLLVTAALDNTVMVWQMPTVPVPADDKAKAPEFRGFASLEEHTNWVLAVAFSTDGKTIVSGGRDNVARVWDLPAVHSLGSPVIVKKSRRVLSGHANAVESVAVSPDGTTVATGSWDNSARTWNANDGKLIHVLSGHQAGLTCVAFSKDGKELATACDPNGPQQGSVRRFELAGGKQIGMHNHQLSARCVLYTPDGEQLFSLGAERVISKFALKDHKPAGQVRPPAAPADTPQIVLSIAYSPDGKHFAAAGENKRVTLWNLATKEPRSWNAHDDVVSSVAFSPDGKLLATASHDKTVKLWDVADWKAGAAAPAVRVIKGHTAWVFTLAFSHDGRKLATGSYDKTVRLWDLAGWKKLADAPPVLVLRTHSAGVRAVAFSADDTLLASGGSDRTARIWAVAKGEQVAILRGHKGTIRALAWSPEGNTLATASEDKSVKLWELFVEPKGGYGYRERAELGGHPDMVAAVAFSPKGRTLAAASWTGQVTLWDPVLAKRRTILFGHNDSVAALAFAPDGRQLASGSFDKTIRFWPAMPLPQGGLVSYAGHKDAAWSVALSPDGKSSATGGRDGALRIYNRHGTQPRVVVENAHRGGITGVAYTPDSQMIVTVGADRKVGVWQANGARIREMSGHSEAIVAVAVSPDGKRAATGGKDKLVLVWDLTAKGSAPLASLSGHTDAIQALAFSPDGKLLASAGVDRSWFLWDTAKWDAKFKAPEGPNNGPFSALAFTPDGKTLALAHNQDQELGPDGDIIRVQYRNLLFVDTGTGKPRTNLGQFVHPDWITGLAYSADGETLITASRDMNVRFWAVKRGQVTRQFRAHNAGIAQIVVSGEDTLATAGEDRLVTLWPAVAATRPMRALLNARPGAVWFAELSNDGQRLATGGSDKQVQLRAGIPGAQPFVFDGIGATIHGLATSPDGKLLASGHEDGTVKMWDATTGKLVKTLTGHKPRVWGLAFTPDSKMLASVSGDWDNKEQPGEVFVWDLATGTRRAFSGHTALVYAVAMSPDGRSLATASHDQTVRLWDITTGKALHVLSGHPGAVRCVSFAPDGATLVSGTGDNGTFIFWDVKEGKEKSRHTLPGQVRISRTRYSPDGKLVAIAINVRPQPQPSPDGTTATVMKAPMGEFGQLLIWDVAGAKVKHTLGNHVGMTLDCAFAPDGATVVTVGGVYAQSGEIMFWDAERGDRLGSITTTEAHRYWLEAVTFTSAGRLVTAGGIARQPGEMRIWEARGFRPLQVLDGYAGHVGTAAFRPDDKQLATGGGDKTIVVWDLTRGPSTGAAARRELKGHSGIIRNVKYSPDGRTLVSSSEDGTVKFWDSTTGELRRTIKVSDKPVYGLAMSADGKRLATGAGNTQMSAAGEVKVWDVATGSLVAELKGFERHVWSVAFSPDGKLLAAAGGQATVRIFDTATWTEKTKLPVALGVRALAFAPDGKTLATASETNNDPVVRVWDVDSGRERVQLQGYPGLLFSLRFSSDGKTLVGCGENASIYVWDVPPARTAVAQK